MVYVLILTKTYPDSTHKSLVLGVFEDSMKAQKIIDNFEDEASYNGDDVEFIDDKYLGRITRITNDCPTGSVVYEYRIVEQKIIK